MSGELDELAAARRVLEQGRTIAVLGAHLESSKPARFVPDYMAAQGYQLLPVNPVFVGQRAWGEPFVGSLLDLAQPVDVIQVFRRGEHLPAHLPEFLAMRPRPRAVWLQLGIRRDGVTAHLREAGIEVVQDRCMMTDHQTLGLPPRG